MRDNRSVYARVQVVVEVSAGTWSPETTMAQVEKQAAEEALNHVQIAFQRDPSVRVVDVRSVAVTLKAESQS